MKRSINIWKGIDKITILLFLMLVTLGWFNIYAAVFNEEHKGILDLSQRYGKQFIWIAATLVLAVFIVIIDVRFYFFFSWFLYIGIMLMLILFFFTLIFSDVSLDIVLVAMAFLLTWFTTRKLRLCLTGLGIFIVIAGPLYVLDHYVINSLGNKLIILISVILSGIAFEYYIYQKKAVSVLIIYLFLLGSIVYVDSVDYVYSHILKPHQRERVEIMLGFKSDPHGTGYNVNQSMISIGSGGLTGKGYLQGTQTKFKFVPAQSTDFIFCTIGEEWGFLGSVTVIGLYIFLLLRLVMLAERQRSLFSRIYGYGVLAVLFTHFFINIGMALGLVPVIGIPLPFLSYGGSSLWGFTILLFIFLRLDASRTEYLV